MCRAGGRRCEHNWTQAQRDARNARRRALYAARSGSAAARTSENSGTSGTAAVESEHTPTVAPPQTTQYPSVLTLVSVNNTAAEGRVREYESAIAEIVERRDSHKDIINSGADEVTTGVMYSDIQKRNEEILKQHDKILQTLRSNGVDDFDLEDVKQELREQIEIIGPNNVNTNVSFRDIHQVRSLIVSAGYKYPLNWDEFGSSEKDLWEERIIANIERQQSRAAR